MIQNTAGQSIGAQMVNASTGAAYVGTVTVYITIDAGVQAIGSVGSGICTAEGNGYYTYRPSQAETNGNLIAFTFIGSGAIPATIQVITITAAQSAAVAVSTAPGAITVSTLLTLAAQRVNILAANEQITGDNGQFMLALTNLWIRSLATERLMIPFILATPFTMTSGKASYTVGVGGDINVAKPVYVTHVNYIDGSLNPPIERELDYLTDDAYQAIPIKNQTNPLPSFYYYNPTYALGTLTFWLVPTSSVLTGVLYAPSAVGVFGSLNDTVILPEGYEFFMVENLAVLFGQTFRENIPIDPGLAQSARDTKADIKRRNTRLIEMSVDPALTYGAPKSNIYTGT